VHFNFVKIRGLQIFLTPKFSNLRYIITDYKYYVCIIVTFIFSDVSRIFNTLVLNQMSYIYTYVCTNICISQWIHTYVHTYLQDVILSSAVFYSSLGHPSSQWKCCHWYLCVSFHCNYDCITLIANRNKRTTNESKTMCCNRKMFNFVSYWLCIYIHIYVCTYALYSWYQQYNMHKIICVRDFSKINHFRTG